MESFQKQLDMISSLGWEVEIVEIICPVETKTVYEAHASQENVHLAGSGDTKEAAIVELLDKIVDATR
jgi:hypothetical protein